MALPAGAVVAGSQGAFLRAVDENLDAAVLRVDALEHLRAVAWVVASTASWSTLTARPTWPVLMQRTGLSRASVARWLRWLRERGLLGVVESGTTPRFAPMALAAEAGNRAALYVLCVPAPATAGVELGDVETSAEPNSRVAVEESETPTFLASDLEKNPYADARENEPTSGVTDPVEEQKLSDNRRSERWPPAAVAGSRTERLALVEALQMIAPALRPASARALRSELRPWLSDPRLGWDVRWLLHALDHTPDGQPHPFTAAVRVPVRWLRYRMSLWRDEHGQPLPSPGAQQAVARSAQQAETAAVRDEHRGQSRQQLEDEQAFAELVREVAGTRYPELIAAVMARELPGRRSLLPAAAAEALTREAIRALLDHTGRDVENMTECRDAVTTAVRHLLG